MKMLFYKSLVNYFASCLILTCNLVSSDDIPAMLWNIQGDALSIKPVSALGHNDKVFADFLKDVHHQVSCIIVFAVNKLSLEDFSANEKPPTSNSTLNNVQSFLDVQPYMLLPSVKDPLNYIHKAHCGVQEIVVDNKIDESIMSSVSSAVQRSCVVILHISDNGIIPKESELKSVFLPSFKNSNKNIIGIFTAVKSSWGVPNNDHHIMRNLLQTTASDDNFVNYTGCIIMYAEDASIKIGNEDNSSVSLPFPPNLDGSACTDTTEILQLAFQTTGVLTSVTLRFEFTQDRGSWSASAAVNMTGERAYKEEITLDTKVIQAPVGFSFSCGDLVLRARNRSVSVAIKMNRFQIQPYQVQEVFSDSFDCVSFFTIPIWMGIFVGLLFIVITNIGVYMLFSVHTMDRFDDPKGKTISVSATAE